MTNEDTVQDMPTIEVREEEASDMDASPSSAASPGSSPAGASPVVDEAKKSDLSKTVDAQPLTLDSTVVSPPPEMAREVKIRLFGRTDVGQVREHNEDNFVVADLTKGSRGLMEVDRLQVVGPRGNVLGVCDGMGGAAAGEVASQLAVDIVYEKMSEGAPPVSRDELAGRLVNAIESAGQRIFSEAKADRSRRGMGTTSTIAALIDEHLFLGQVGDSRGYLLRGDRLVQVTRDQSLVNQLIEAGQLTEEEAETFEHNNIILQALGTSESVQVDLTFVELRRGDILLLCSDGLSGMVRNDEIREVLRMSSEPIEMCRELTDRANQAGGHDNVTVVVAKFEGDGLEAPTDEDIASLKYRKYDLPERAHPEPKVAPRTPNRSPKTPTTRSPERPEPDQQRREVVRNRHPGAGEDSIDLPQNQTPQWLTTMLIVSAVTCVVVLGYYFLR